MLSEAFLPNNNTSTSFGIRALAQDGTFHDMVRVLDKKHLDPSLWSSPYPVEEPVPEEWKYGCAEVSRENATDSPFHRHYRHAL